MGIKREQQQICVQKQVQRDGYREKATKNLCSEMGRERERERQRIYVQKGKRIVERNNKKKVRKLII